MMNVSIDRARLQLFVLAIAMVCLIGSPVSAQMRRSMPASNPAMYRVSTKNFVVTAASHSFARKVADEAERFRKQLSQEWLGYEIAPWNERCPIVVKIAPHAGGVTRFMFVSDGQKSRPVEWEMEVYGPPLRILDSVLPHEVTHTIFASHFGRQLPRWADEGACTTVEHESEKAKNHRMLMRFLSTSPSRGIPFNRMFMMFEYPNDMLPLYAQGYSLARFLVQQKGKREFIRYVETGLKNADRQLGLRGWDLATKSVYGFEDLSELQLGWLDWVKKGCPRHDRVASSQEPASTSAASFSHVPAVNPQSEIRSAANPAGLDDNWYVRQMNSPSPTSPVLVSTHNSAQSETSTGYRPGSIAGAQPLKRVADSAFLTPSKKSLIRHRSIWQAKTPANQTQSRAENSRNPFHARPTIYR